jgi:Outer membrane protein beta-barrel domain
VRCYTHLCMAILLTITTVSLMAGSTLAQEKPSNRVGFLGGLNIANQNGDMELIGRIAAVEAANEFGGGWSSRTTPMLGMGFGAFYVRQVSADFGVQFEGQYIRRGGQIDLTATNVLGLPSPTTFETEFQVNYIEFAVLARFSSAPKAKFRPLVLAGPVIGHKVGADLKLSVLDESQSQSISNDYEDLTLGLLGGLGFSVQTGPASFLTLQARYYHGLSNPMNSDVFETKSSDLAIFAGVEILSR